MTRVVINTCYGGFGLSDEALNLYKERKGITDKIYDDDIPRHDPVLVDIVEELGDRANTSCSELEITCINANKYYIDEYDGLETVVTPDIIRWIEVKSDSVYIRP